MIVNIDDKENKKIIPGKPTDHKGHYSTKQQQGFSYPLQ